MAVWAERLLRMKKIPAGELVVLVAGTRRMQTINKTFRKIDKPTDVLAFNMREGENAGGWPPFAGDIVICAEIARRCAKVYKKTVTEEICLYLVHGILHLLGYDDETSENRRVMEEEQTKICSELLNCNINF